MSGLWTAIAALALVHAPPLLQLGRNGRTASPAITMQAPPPPQPSFCMETATLLAGFAFETYNQPDVEWINSADGVRTALLSPAFEQITLHHLFANTANEATLLAVRAAAPVAIPSALPEAPAEEMAAARAAARAAELEGTKGDLQL